MQEGEGVLRTTAIDDGWKAMELFKPRFWLKASMVTRSSMLVREHGQPFRMLRFGQRRSLKRPQNCS